MNRIKEWFLLAKWKLGMMTREEAFSHMRDEDEWVEKLPPQERPQFRQLFRETRSLESARDPGEYFKTARKITAKLDSLEKQYGTANLHPDVVDKIGQINAIDGLYRPTGSRAGKWFINPFALYSFYREKHYATSACIDILLTAARRNGFGFKSASGVSKKRIKQFATDCKRLKIKSLRVEMLHNFLTYRNCVIVIHKNLLGGLQRLEVIPMDRLTPIYNDNEEIVKWDHWLGTVSHLYEASEVIHFFEPSLKNPEIGCPFLAPLAVDIESDLSASDFNATAMYKGGMMGLLIQTEDTNVSRKGESKLAARLREEIQNMHVGVKGAGSVLVSNIVKNVHKLSQLGDFDGSFLKLRQEIAKSIATIYQVPPARLNVGLKSAGVVDNGKIHDSSSQAMDWAVSGYMEMVDDCLRTNVFVNLMGVRDIWIEAHGKYGQFNVNSAIALKNFVQCGPMFTVDEARTMFAGMPPVGGDRGRIIMDASNRIAQGDVYEQAESVKPIDYDDDTYGAEGEN